MGQEGDSTHPRVRGPPPGATEVPEHVKKPQVYEIFHGPGSEPNRDGGGVPPPSGQPDDGQQKPSSGAARPTFKDGIQSIKPDDFLNVHKIPCARQSFLTGIGVGAVVGMGRFVFGSKAHA